MGGRAKGRQAKKGRGDGEQGAQERQRQAAVRELGRWQGNAGPVLLRSQLHVRPAAWVSTGEERCCKM